MTKARMRGIIYMTTKEKAKISRVLRKEGITVETPPAQTSEQIYKYRQRRDGDLFEKTLAFQIRRNSDL